MGQRIVTPSQLNALRDDVLRAAVARAAEPQGVFTLTVPTGGGKTLTSLAFALAHAREHSLDPIIVVIPFGRPHSHAGVGCAMCDRLTPRRKNGGALQHRQV
jgi:type II secretory pathway predicted ATPase ExeA